VSKLPDKEAKIIGDRLWEIRRAWGFVSVREWAEYIGVGDTAWVSIRGEPPCGDARVRAD
jgi:hypothetical protein